MLRIIVCVYLLSFYSAVRLRGIRLSRLINITYITYLWNAATVMCVSVCISLCLCLCLCVWSDQQLSDCFLVHFTPTQTCTEAFDKFFRSFVTDKQYSNACR